ncbi:MAG: hypothetical protein AOA65_1364 [Candidatus Bathyarchaeota archaeon BA1]|nr:MAG: hypothetical protein AOA65_1364 [Candidatus Bathyarchaeota archaeon BA1]
MLLSPPCIPWSLDEIARIAKVAKEHVVVDIQSDHVKTLQALGYNALCDDGEKVNLGRKFDSYGAATRTCQQSRNLS